jgi:hypothetical protein
MGGVKRDSAVENTGQDSLHTMQLGRSVLTHCRWGYILFVFSSNLEFGGAEDLHL